MTDLLRRAIEQLSQLPEPEQDIVAAWILDELEAERRWEELLTVSKDTLAQLAEEALQEHRAGRTEALDPNNLLSIVSNASPLIHLAHR